MSQRNNIFSLEGPSYFDEQKIGIKGISLERLLKMSLVCIMRGFAAQDKNQTEYSSRIYYVPTRESIYTKEQIKKLFDENPNEEFLLVSDNYSGYNNLWAYIDTKDNVLKTTIIGLGVKTGKMIPLVELNNKFGTAEWDDENCKILDNKAVDKLYQDTSRNYRGNNEPNPYHIALHTEPKDSYRSDVYNFLVVGNIEGRQADSNNLIRDYLQIPGKTRLMLEIYNDTLSYKIGVSAEALESPIKRLGIRVERDPNENRYYDSYKYKLFHTDEEFDDGAELDKATFSRISNEITEKLKAGEGKEPRMDYYQRSSIVKVYDMLAISSPVGGHRRPTYHLIRGFKVGEAIDVIEICRGELLIKDMLPVSCYYLNGLNGKYCLVSHRLFSTVKEIVQNAHVDETTFQTWTEERSLHPSLLKAVASCAAGSISLPTIKQFNRIPFGALFLEHLIKQECFKTAEFFSDYIMERADNMNYVCSSLEDVLPGCDPEGSSLSKILNFDKIVTDMLLKEQPERFIDRYIALRRFCADGVTKDKLEMVDKYMNLVSEGWHQWRCRTGRTVNIIDYPADLKSVNKMLTKIQSFFSSSNSWEARRHYQEIVEAYFQFKDFGWDPEKYQIFIEFGLGSDEGAAMKMLRDREHAANTALAIYNDKINEIAHRESEAKYAYRKKHALSKLESTATMAKAKGSLFNKYIVIAPSQIYGETVVGSIEKEGSDMDHCVYRSYAGQIANGEYTVMYLRLKDDPEKSLVTIGIDRKGRINQTFGLHDSQITKEQAEAILEWANAKKGLVNFKSEHYDVRPGGWNPSVSIPETEEITDKDWLKKLRKTKADEVVDA